MTAGECQPGKIGERGRIRTCDPRLKRALLYHLSYAPTLLKTLLHGLRTGQSYCTLTAQKLRLLDESL